MTQIKLMIILLLGACLSLGCSKAESGGGFAHETSDLKADEAVEYGTLPNGLRYAVMANATPSNTASLLMRIDTGSVNEKADERGLAHFLEHMAFNGSDNLAEDELIKRLEKYGLEFGPDTNASTDFTQTTYSLQLPEINDEIIDETLMIMREIAERLTLDDEAIERERGVILSEKRARNSPAYKAGVASLRYFLGGSRFAERIPIGTEESIKAVTSQQFREFYHGFYRPENTFIVLVGDFETGYAADKIAHFFGDWVAKGTPLSPYKPESLAPRDLEAYYYVDPEITTSISINVMGTPDQRKDTAANRKDYFIEGLGNRILSRRLGRLAQSPDAVFISAGAQTSNLYDVIAMSRIGLSAKPDKWAEALAVGEQELRRAVQFGFTPAELDEQIANTRSSLDVAVQTAATRRTPSLAYGILGGFSRENVVTSPQANLDLFNSYVDQITPELVHEAFKAQWRGYQAPQIYLSTSAMLEDAESSILEAYQASQTVDVAPNEQVNLGEFAYTDFGAPGQVASRQHIEDIDFFTVTFDNNVRLNIKKTPYEENLIRVSVTLGSGSLSLPDDQLGLEWLASNVLSLGGLEAHSQDEIRTLMAGKAVGVGFDVGSQRIFLTGSTTPDDLSDQLNLMTAYLVGAGYRPEAKARYDKFIQSYYPTLDSTPGAVASRDIPRLLRSGDKRFGILDESVLLDAKVEDLQKWLQPQLTQSSVEIGIVGDVDPDKIIQEVGRTFGALPERESQFYKADAALTKLKFPVGSERPVKLTHSGEDDTALVRVYWPAPDGTDALVARQTSLLMDIFQLRLTEVLREAEGASYSPSVLTYQSRTYPDYGYVGVSAEVAPEDVDKVSEIIYKIASDVRKGDFTQDMFERAVTPVLENIENSLESNGYWIGVIRQSQSDPERLERHRNRESDYESLNLEIMKQVGAELFAPENAVTYYVLPEK